MPTRTKIEGNDLEQLRGHFVCRLTFFTSPTFGSPTIGPTTMDSEGGLWGGGLSLLSLSLAYPGLMV